MTTVHRGHIFHIAGAPLVTEAAANLAHFPDGALVVSDAGIIEFCGDWADLPAEHAGATVVDHHGAFLLPGFVDTHMHFPQVWCGDSYGGGQLLEWLNNCIFPSESKFEDPEYAKRAAVEWVDRMITAGTTNGLIFGSAFPHAEDFLFEEARNRGLRIVAGRGIQTTGPASGERLMTSEAEAIDLTRAEIEKWHPLTPEAYSEALQYVAVVPRFSLSVTPTTLAALGELYDEYRDKGVYFTSHLNENARPVTGEIDSTKAVYDVNSYLDTYDGKFLPGSKVGGKSLLGPRSVMAHSVHCTDAELARMAETGTSIAHCPVSQLFLGSGTLPWKRTVAAGVNIAIGSDWGAGDEWFIPQVLNACFKVHISERQPVGMDPYPSDDQSLSLHPAELLFTGTLAGARALALEDRTGNFDVGKEADFVVLDPSAWDMYDQTLKNMHLSDDPTTARDAFLFAVIMLAREKSLTGTYVRGRKLETSTSH
jgi:guanine deaminase